MARKPIEKGLTVTQNVLKWGTGGINIGDCLIEFENEEDYNSATYGTGTNILGGNYVGSKLTDGRKNIEANPNGRFPSNVIFDPFTANELNQQSGLLKSGTKKLSHNKKSDQNGHKISSVYGKYKAIDQNIVGNEGYASRFFYCAKASQFERNAGCESLEAIKVNDGHGDRTGTNNAYQRAENERNNHHPTIKPIMLMRWLQRLVTPKGGKTLDPFAGSGTSGCSAYFEDIGEIVLIEMEESYLPIIEARTKYWSIEKNRMNYLDDIRVKKDEPIENQMKLF